MRPLVVDEIWAATQRLGFPMASEPETGRLLRTLVASKPAGRLLELGTGTGLGTAWMLDGMDALTTLVSVDHAPEYLAIARHFLGKDSRLTLHEEDGAIFIESLAGQHFDFIFADTWAGKFTHLDEALALLAPGGFYFIDDLLPQPSWPDNHEASVRRLIATLNERPDLQLIYLDYATGVLIAAKILGIENQPSS